MGYNNKIIVMESIVNLVRLNSVLISIIVVINSININILLILGVCFWVCRKVCVNIMSKKIVSVLLIDM